MDHPSPLPSAQHQTSHAAESEPYKISSICLPAICHSCKSFANLWYFGYQYNFRPTLLKEKKKKEKNIKCPWKEPYEPFSC